ncbi:Eco57I restriction-modification methylase domain-containing protein [Oleiharenicola lentus]|uniref:Eco57I restriction-modification methylase domain-containing protein n=1 Tax=Oleiharenicola lentus TaxID=2508720 RepID=UPI003F68005E
MAAPASQQPRLRTIAARELLQKFNFTDLFIEELGWNNPAQSRGVSIKDQNETLWQSHEIAQLSGFRVFEVTPADRVTPLPDAATQATIWKALDAHAVEKLVIFVDRARTQSLWYWRKREGSRFLPRRHPYLKGQPGDLFLSKLSALVVDLSELDENGNLPITETANRVRAALDIEQVTKAFFRDFQAQHTAFLEHIHGITDARERRWYASVLLNRLMFIWFMQVKGFLDVARLPDGDRQYLPRQFAAAQKSGKNRFFSHFLRDLFFEGFAKPDQKRAQIGTLQLGDIPYLNGGLFLPHGIEARLEGEALFAGPYQRIKIADAAFAGLFELFGRYSWSLNDTPGGDDREINPDVLGYIFEKYINQKEFGAYYTRPEITDYLTEQTVHQLLLDAASRWTGNAIQLHAAGITKGVKPCNFETVGDLLLHADGPLCQHLLQETLPKLSLLDPACGSGAFIVACLKTLLNLTTGLIGRCEALNHRPVLQWIEHERKLHKAPPVYWLKKRIITENLFGVDIMEEAVEIAKLRLFLNLVASADKRDQLEPLPNIEFNLLAGNSLIGLLKVDASAFDAKTRTASGDQGSAILAHESELGFTVESKTAPTEKQKATAFIGEQSKAKYAELLREKNRLVRLYRESTSLTQDLASLREEIEDHKIKARLVLDRQLLKSFVAHGVEFAQATWDARKNEEGKPAKRPLTLDDIRALHPFHWAYEFDEILHDRGGFDAIITNPPWEVFKPQAKEFFNDYSELVTVNNMTIKEFEEEQSRLLQNPKVRDAWLEYLSRFPHVSAWFRSADQFRNQISLVDGKKVGTDINLYKLFLEQCLSLLSPAGLCGIVIPTGIYTDLGCKQLREMLFVETAITSLFGLANEKFLFDGVHHAFKICVLTFRKGIPTKKFHAAFRINPREAVRAQDLYSLFHNPEIQIELDIEEIRKFSPDSLSIVEFRGPLDYAIVAKTSRFPRLGEELNDSWNVRLQSEFHMTNDSHLFQQSPLKGSRPLFEGKMVHQFTDEFSPPRYWVDEKAARKALLGRTPDGGQSLDYQAYRLGIRKIARSSDERTLIASILAPSFHAENFQTVRVFDEDGNRMIGNDVLLYLCAIWNSLAVDFLIRLRVSANVNFFYVYQLSVPRIDATNDAFRPLVEGAARLIGTSAKFDELLKEVFGPKANHRTHGIASPADRQQIRAELDALVAQLYGLTAEEFAHILTTFPLVPESVRLNTQQIYARLLRTGVLS